MRVVSDMGISPHHFGRKKGRMSTLKYVHYSRQKKILLPLPDRPQTSPDLLAFCLCIPFHPPSTMKSLLHSSFSSFSLLNCWGLTATEEQRGGGAGISAVDNGKALMVSSFSIPSFSTPPLLGRYPLNPSDQAWKGEREGGDVKGRRRRMVSSSLAITGVLHTVHLPPG